MVRDHFNAASAADPKRRKLLDQAFQEVWHDIAGNYDATMIQDRQARLAEVILRLAQDGECDLGEIMSKALVIMRAKEQHIRH